MARETDGGAALTQSQPSSGATKSNVASSATAVTLLNANPLRTGLKIKNDSNATLYISYGAGASLTSFTEDVAPTGVWTMDVLYTGLITGIWSSANGFARLTELSA